MHTSVIDAVLDFVCECRLGPSPFSIVLPRSDLYLFLSKSPASLRKGTEVTDSLTQIQGEIMRQTSELSTRCSYFLIKHKNPLQKKN